ncbi:amino acid permease [Streptomyces griseoluteus]|uniref:amino acid permease n=1 Tax=Streptomyces griseoluteus TaxID=29306 RepID=UPI003830E053
MAVGIFSTYDDVLQNAGPVGIWLWVVATVGQVLVALVVAQLAGRIPLSGSSYQWASRLADPKVGWGFGWLSFCYLAIAVVAVDNALASQASRRWERWRRHRSRRAAVPGRTRRSRPGPAESARRRCPVLRVFPSRHRARSRRARHGGGRTCRRGGCS